MYRLILNQFTMALQCNYFSVGSAFGLGSVKGTQTASQKRINMGTNDAPESARVVSVFSKFFEPARVTAAAQVRA